MPLPLARRIAYWYGKHGLAGFVRLALVRVWRRLFQNAEVMFSVDSTELDESSFVPRAGFAVERYDSEDQIPREDLDRIAAFKGGGEIVHDYMSGFFCRGAVFWLARLNGEPAGYHWSIRGGFEGFYKFPMTSRDAVLVSSEVFMPYRGKGVNPTMIQNILFQLKKDGVTRMHISCKVWNKANLRSIPKTSFRMLATVGEAGLFGRRIIIWRPPFPRPDV